MAIWQNTCIALYGVLISVQWIAGFCREHQLPHESNRACCFGTVQFFSLIAVVLQDICCRNSARLALGAGPELFMLATHAIGATACLVWLRGFESTEKRAGFVSRFLIDTSSS
jgi:hypothetical protein